MYNRKRKSITADILIKDHVQFDVILKSKIKST